MLYQQRTIGQRGLWARLTAGLAMSLAGRKKGDLDLLSMNAHLRRDIGLDEGHGGSARHAVWQR